MALSHHESLLENVLEFWFSAEEEWRAGLWFQGIDPQNGVTMSREERKRLTPSQLKSRTDDYILRRFHTLMITLDAEELTTTRQKVAAIILWDRLAPKLHDFAHQTKAQKLAAELASSQDPLPWTHALFVCLALLDAEDAALVERGMERLQKMMIEAQHDEKMQRRLRGIETAFVRHRRILQKFGRYPSRNEALDRPSTPAEAEYLKPSSSKRGGKRLDENDPSIDADDDPGKKPLRILVLHGNRANLRKFKSKVRDKLKRIGSREAPVALDFIKSPNVYGDGVMTEVEAYERDNRCWWRVVEDEDGGAGSVDGSPRVRYAGLERGVEALEGWFRHNGAYDGVVGFSQGAAMAAILAAKMDAGRLQHVRFRFLICISGFDVRDAGCAGLFRPGGRKIRVPSFHTWGEADAEIDACRSVRLAEAFHDPTAVSHRGEHLIRCVEFWPTGDMNAWLKNLCIVPLQEDVGPFATFEEKFQALKRKHAATSQKGTILRPVGLHHQEEIMKDPFWEETASIANVNAIPFETAKAFLPRLLQISPNEEGLDMNLVDDLMMVLWCVYPLGLARKKESEQKTEGQPFYLMFRLLLDGISCPRGRDRLVRYHLPFVSKHANSWDALNRIDLMFHTGSSLYGSDFPKLIDGPSPFAAEVHVAIARIFAEQLAKDFKTVQEAIVSYGDKHERVIQMQLALPSKCAEHAPRIHGFVHKTTGLDRSIAKEFTAVSKEAVNALPGSPRNRYDSARKAIKRFLADYKSSVGNLQDVKERGLQDYSNCSLQEWWSLHEKPISQAVLYPKPEPVEVATPEQMAPLQEFLNKSPMVLPEPEVTFDRGTLLNDGRLDLCKQVIGPKGIDPLFKSLKYDGHGLVKHILLGNNIAGNELGRAVGEFITSGESKLTTWYVAGNRMNVEGIKPIAEALAHDRQVLQLWLKRNPILPLGAVHIASMLRVNTTLQVLDLTNSGILDDGCKTVMQGLMDNERSALEYLYLDTNCITPKGVSAVTRYLTLTANRSLVGLSLGCNRLRDEGVSILLKGVRQYKSLKRITLSSCGISAAGAQMVAEYLKEPDCDLRFLDLGCMKSTWAVGEIPNRIGSAGSVALADALGVNTRLQGLSLGNNFILEDGITAIEEALSRNQSSGLRSLVIQQPGLASSKTTLDKIHLWVERNAGAWEQSNESDTLDDYVFPKHLDDIQSVYRVGDSYDK